MLTEKQLLKFAKLFEEKLKPAILKNKDEFILAGERAREYLNDKCTLPEVK